MFIYVYYIILWKGDVFLNMLQKSIYTLEGEQRQEMFLAILKFRILKTFERGGNPIKTTSKG